MLQDVHANAIMIAGSFILIITICLTILKYSLRRFRQMARQSGNDITNLEQAYADAPIGLAMLDKDLRYIRINKLLAQLNGVAVEEHIGKTIRDIVPDVAPQAEAPFLQVVHTGKPLIGIVFEGITNSQPGMRRFWRESIYPYFTDKGEVAGIHVAVQEITEEKRLYDALKASELRERLRASELEAVMNATPAAIFLSHDPKCNHMTGNAEANRMLRMKPGENPSANSPEESRKRPFAEYANGRPLRPEELPMQVAAASGREVRGAEVSLHFEDGNILHTLVNAAPLFNPSGEVAGAVAAFIDVTAQKHAEQTLVRDSERKDEFLAILAHELRNPLAAIQNGFELMRLTDNASPSLTRTHAIIERQLSHLVRIIDDLLDISRINSGKLGLQKEKVCVRIMIDNALEACRLYIDATGHEFKVDFPSEPLYVNADIVRMVQVLNNLLNNAAKYTPEGGRIRLEARKENGTAVIRVIDNGIGIEGGMLNRIFDMFSQAESARDHRRGGLGVGLSLAKRLVEMHDGSLTADSGGTGKGSTFTVRLPLYEAVATMIPGRTDDGVGHASPENRRILILDDNVDAAQTLGALLEMGGHDIQLAYTGREAVKLARQFQPDIAFLDIGLPDMSGLDVARALRREDATQGSTLVALTGWGNQKDRTESKDAGFDFHLTKPVTLEAIQNIIPALKMPVGR